MRFALINSSNIVENIIIASETYVAPDGYTAVEIIENVHCSIGDLYENESFTPVVPASEAIDIIIKRKILEAIKFGEELMIEYATSNILAGLNVEQVKYIIHETKEVQQALSTGSLYVALEELNNLTLDEVMITESRVATFRNKIQVYLGIPET